MSASSPSGRRWWGVDGRLLPMAVGRPRMVLATAFVIIHIVTVAASLPGAAVVATTDGLLVEFVTGAVATEIGATLIFFLFADMV